MKKTDISYIAGFIDADGSITIVKENPSSYNRRANPSYTPSMAAYSTKEEVVIFIQNILGGAYSFRKGRKNRQDGYEWRVGGQQIKKNITTLYPYLKVKKKQAEIILELINWKERNKKSHEVSYNQKGIEYLESLYQTIGKLQLRGKKKPASASK
jgi:hypothetical protein